jgi:hypothetical protein
MTQIESQSEDSEESELLKWKLMISFEGYTNTRLLTSGQAIMAIHLRQIVHAGHINAKPEGHTMFGDPEGCHHCYCPASSFLHPGLLCQPKIGTPIISKMLTAATRPRYVGLTGRESEVKHCWLVSQQ